MIAMPFLNSVRHTPDISDTPPMGWIFRYINELKGFNANISKVKFYETTTVILGNIPHINFLFSEHLCSS